IPCCEAVFSADQFVKIIADSSRIRHCKKLALRAIRALIGTNFIAGVRVTGTADEPKAEIFSDPAMPQAEALSYLLRGQGLDSNQ
ncbi:translocation/assembly module TamB domain-containing protein, partial [Salmonella enterica subsp. enterica serovar Anatum]|nr:translocation/assembly module TamB domain-containing protein [Salmonella enterica subsp. enterica serovar Anatum]